jgi:hypothetical protein
VQDSLKERWLGLCEQAAKEKDSRRLMKLIEEIDRLMREKELPKNRPADSEKPKLPQNLSGSERAS